ncbi:pyridine nucleotide-disulfide [Apiospora arundinis]
MLTISSRCAASLGRALPSHPTRISKLPAPNWSMQWRAMLVRSVSTVTEGKATDEKERIVILGSGWAGYGFARTLDPKKFERVMISPRSYFVFTPLLAGTAVGTLEFRATLEPVRRLGLDHFHQGWANDIDFNRKVIRVEANVSDDLASRTTWAISDKPSGLRSKQGETFDVPYDKLVIACGSYSQTFGIEGVRQHAFFLRDVGDARKIRLKVLQCFERATLPTTSDRDRKKLLHFAIVGGGPTGIEFAAELHDLIRDDLSKLYPGLQGFVGITIYDVAPKGIQVKTEHHLISMKPDEECEGCMRLKIQEYEDEEVNAGMVVWSTGLMQNPLVEKLTGKLFDCPPIAGGDGLSGPVKLQKDPKTGSILTDHHLRVNVIPEETPVEKSNRSHPGAMTDVYAIGDCAALPDQALPATAQVASQKAVHLAKRLNKGGMGEKEFNFRNWGTMTYLGNWKAIHQSSADDLKGWAAWVLWRTAYLTKSMSIRNKIMVPIYWCITWLFGRDISRF